MAYDASHWREGVISSAGHHGALSEGEEDDRLVALCLAGDKAAFAQLVRRHQGAVRALARRLSRQQADLADDIAQDAFVKAHAKLDTYQGGGRFRAWLLSVTTREFLMTRRKLKAQERTRDAYQAEMDAQPLSSPGATGAAMDIERAMAELREDERVAVTLCCAAGLTNEEAAEAMGKPLGSLKSLVQRGRAKLAKALRDYDPHGQMRDGKEG